MCALFTFKYKHTPPQIVFYTLVFKVLVFRGHIEPCANIYFERLHQLRHSNIPINFVTSRDGFLPIAMTACYTYLPISSALAQECMRDNFLLIAPYYLHRD